MTIQIPEEYLAFDYGFSSVDEPPPNPTVVAEADAQKAKIQQLEAIIVPLLNNLLKTADKDYIYWPNRKSIIEEQLQKVLQITRG